MEEAWDHSSMGWVSKEAQKNNNNVHFASLRDLCHLKNSELEPQFQKYKGRVVFRGAFVKDDSGAYAVFVEQGSSAAQMTAAKVMDVVARLLDCDGQAADATSAYTQVKMWRSRCSSWAKLVRTPTRRTLVGKTGRKSIAGTWLGKSTQIGNSYSFTENKSYSYRCVWMTSKWSEEAEFYHLCGRNWWKTLILRSQHHFLITFSLCCIQRRCNPTEKIVGQDSNMFRIPYFCWRAWSHDVEGHDRKCVERCCELANEKTEQQNKVSHPCLDDHKIRKEELEMLVPGTKWSTWHSVVSQ